MLRKYLFVEQMKKNGDRIPDIAAALGICTSAMSKKLNGKSQFTLEEIDTYRKRYAVSDEKLIEIFFS